ncbi:FkbM family methyltransferase [Yeosuana sp. MJ-SS3]|uniref:FkbM family methyltransferase n=1 Tax=Gilvirhabdus luticola TaxID=3079858 RepID=A0ABU3U8M6_9FLAO|nr:FkbM family methyltransferase [Yeosuana sp. MJ-SS3]MDU8886440.1 FkbM family methyltransferase [Yeosuana sp. MJ-SS3]
MNIRLPLKYYRKKRFYKKLIKKNSLCFDIGANVGFKSKIFLSLGARVVAFEPQSQCHATLSQIKNPQFTLVKKALGSTNKKSILHVANHIEIATLSSKFIEHFTSENIFWNDTEYIETETIDKQIELFGIPDFCKIDTEGFEFEILKNLTYAIPLLEFEFTDGFLNETLKCIKKLSTLGNYEYNFILNENNYFELSKWENKNSIGSIINSLPTNRLHGNIFAKLV